MADISRYDCLDFGASKGGSIEFARRVLSGERPLGLDIDPKKVALMKAEGFDCIEADVTALELPENSVRFVVMSHFLEHLPSLDHVQKAIESAARVAREFLFIQGPFFDADEMLAAQGLRFYWSYWSGHTCHLTSGQLRDILDTLGLCNYRLMFNGEVTSARDKAIHPLESKKNQQEYDPNAHPPKVDARFQPCLFREMVCLVKVGDMDGWHDLVRRVGENKRTVTFEACRSGRRGLRSGDEGSSSDPLVNKRILKLREFLLVRRRWEILDYLHLRDAILRSAPSESALIVTADTGHGAVALALEFPQIRFHIGAAFDAPKVEEARKVALEWSLNNVVFEGPGGEGIPESAGFEFVALCNLIHRSANLGAVVSRAFEAARRWVYATTPRAPAGKASPRGSGPREGFSKREFETLFHGAGARGCYWRHRGQLFREWITQLSDAEIRNNVDELSVEASMDLIDAEPLTRSEALGMTVLAACPDEW